MWKEEESLNCSSPLFPDLHVYTHAVTTFFLPLRIYFQHKISFLFSATTLCPYYLSVLMNMKKSNKD